MEVSTRTAWILYGLGVLTAILGYFYKGVLITAMVALLLASVALTAWEEK